MSATRFGPHPGIGYGVLAMLAAHAAVGLDLPIVTYWAGPGFPGGPALDDAAAQQLAEGGFNLVWCHEAELDVVARQGLRGLLHDALLYPAEETFAEPERLARLNALIERVKDHPGLAAYHLQDEPGAGRFPIIAKMVAYLRERDPLHFAYVNLFPIYANNEQLGVAGEPVPAYREHVRQYLEMVRPELLSYDHYHFATGGDGGSYFLNLALIREAAQGAGIPFLNIVQACTWTPGMRVPTEDEVRWLVYTSLAYGAQAISYYVYGYPNHTGGFATLEGQTTPLFDAGRRFNREFAAIVTQLKPLASLAVYHAGSAPAGATALPVDSPFVLDPPLPALPAAPPAPVTGYVLGLFGPPGHEAGAATHAVVVNLDYRQEQTVTVVGRGPLEVYHPLEDRWSAADDTRVVLKLPAGGGVLLRTR